MIPAALALVLLAGTAQGTPMRPQAADSAELRREARDAQAEFERRRRRWLPENRDWPGGGTCDEVVGRICLRYGEGSDWYLEPEDPRISEAREALLTVLARTSEALPGDGWILGQRVFYLVEAGRAAEAAEVARRCGAVAPWWCGALEGYALHRDGLFEAAAGAFRSALAGMDPERARAWRDPAVLVDGKGRDALDRAEDAGRRDAAERRFWDLADPLYLVPGNDRWTSHMARHVVSEIRERARSPWTISWGPDMAELAVRYGWEVGWEIQASGRISLQDRPGVVGHHDPESRSFVPDGSALLDPARSTPDAWGTGREAARSGHAPAYAPVTLPGDGQIAVFPRGDRVVVVASQALPQDTTFHGSHHHALRDSVPLRWRDALPAMGLFLVPVDLPGGSDDPDPSGAGPPGLLRALRGGASEGVLTLEATAGDYVVSAETWSPAQRRAGRTRRGLSAAPVPPDVATLSDLLLLDAPSAEGEGLEGAAAGTLTRDWLQVGEAVAIGWEVFGFGRRSEVLSYRLSVEDSRGNLIRRAGRWLGLVGDPPRRTLDWSEDGPAGPGPAFRSVALDVRDLAPATYVLRLELRSEGRAILVSERPLSLRPAQPAPPPPPR